MSIQGDDGVGEVGVWRGRIEQHLQQSAALKMRVASECIPSILNAANLIASTFRAGRKLMLCGNGGSAADCQHMAAEFVSRLNRNFERPGLPALSLTTDTSFLTAFANDNEFGGVFERQVTALGQGGDAIIGISTSGSSENVLRAVRAARQLEMRSIGLMGCAGMLKELVDVAIAIPDSHTQYLQEAFLCVEHVICDITEQLLFGEGGKR